MQHEEVIFDKLHEIAYQGCGLGRTILGPEQNILSITRDDLTSYIKTHYTGPRIVVSGAGAVEHAQLVDLADKFFGKLPSSPPTGYTVPVDPVAFSGAEIRSKVTLLPSSLCVFVCVFRCPVRCGLGCWARVRLISLPAVVCRARVCVLSTDCLLTGMHAG